MATPNTKTMSMKLLVDSKAQRVLFAEASKDVVDLLFSLLALPLGAAVKLLQKDYSMVGSIGDIYASFETLDAAYVAPGAFKDTLLAPSPAVGAGALACSLLGLPEPGVFFFECEFGCRGNYLADTPGVKCPKCDDEKRAKCLYLPMPAHEMKLFKSKRCDARVVTDASGTPCPCPDGCRQKLAEPCQYVPPQQAVVPGGGFVQGIVTYTVTDSLAVAPMSSSVALRSTFAALDLGAVQEKTVQLGHTEALEILRTSLQSRTVLTDVFLGNQEPRDAA